MGFEREGSGKYRWAGLTLPYDAAPEIYGPLVGCVLSRLRVLDDADEDWRLPVEMRQTAREFVDVWWALVDGEVVFSRRGRKQVSVVSVEPRVAAAAE